MPELKPRYEELPLAVGDYVLIDDQTVSEHVTREPMRVIALRYQVTQTEDKLGVGVKTWFSDVEVQFSYTDIQGRTRQERLWYEADMMRKVEPPVPHFDSVEDAEAWLQANQPASKGSWVDDLEATLQPPPRVTCESCGCGHCVNSPSHVATGPACRCSQAGCPCLL